MDGMLWYHVVCRVGVNRMRLVLAHYWIKSRRPNRLRMALQVMKVAIWTLTLDWMMKAMGTVVWTMLDTVGTSNEVKYAWPPPSIFWPSFSPGSQSEEDEDDIEAETTDGFLIPGLSSSRVAYMTPQRIKPLPASMADAAPSTTSSSSRKTRKVMYVEKDEDGNYRLPVQIGALTLLSLGQVIWNREGFHNDRYIWPVGYSVQRYARVRARERACEFWFMCLLLVA